MPRDDKWNEAGRVWDEDDTELSDAQLAQCSRADVADPFDSPVPTRVVSNGEYMPPPQSAAQKQVEARVRELTEAGSKRLGIDRRRFLRTSGGMAAAFVAMNDVFGRFFDVDPIEMFEPTVYAQNGAPRDLFVMDQHVHMARGSSSGSAAMGLRQLASGRPNPYNPNNVPDELGNVNPVWNPALVGLPELPENFHIVQFIKDIYLDSQLTVALLIAVPGSSVVSDGERRPPKHWIEVESSRGEILSARQSTAARNFVNEISGSTRMLAAGTLYPGKGNLEFLQKQIDEYEVDAWKGFNMSSTAKVDDDPDSVFKQWRHDDEDVAYPTWELIQKNYDRLKATKPGLRNICVHKGLNPGWRTGTAEAGHPRDLPKAATDWPNLNFVTYHSCLAPNMFQGEAMEEVLKKRLRSGVPDIPWTTEYALLVAPFENCYAELATAWASSVVQFPTLAAHILGQLLKFLGPDRIVFGSDSVWYGSPQWQIDAFWRFQIPEDLRRQYGYPELSDDIKRKILGLNGAKLYGLNAASGAAKDRIYRRVPDDYEARMSDELKETMELNGGTAGEAEYLAYDDNMSRFREKYLAQGPQPSNTRYGWIRTD